MILSQTGWKWFCTKCGYNHHGELALDECPNCYEWSSFIKIHD